MLMNEPTSQKIVLAAALCHAAQIPAMAVTSRILSWQAPTELNRRIRKVLDWTIPALLGGLTISLVANHRAPLSPLGLGVWVIVLGEFGLRARALFDSQQTAARAFARSRQEIVFLLVGLGLVIGLNSREVVTSPLGGSLCLLLALLYASRTLIQLLAYASHWPSKPLLRLAHWGLVLLFSIQTSLYALSATRWIGRNL